jgi:hypothetical protein
VKFTSPAPTSSSSTIASMSPFLPCSRRHAICPRASRKAPTNALLRGCSRVRVGQHFRSLWWLAPRGGGDHDGFVLRRALKRGRGHHRTVRGPRGHRVRCGGDIDTYWWSGGRPSIGIGNPWADFVFPDQPRRSRRRPPQHPVGDLRVLPEVIILSPWPPTGCRACFRRSAASISTARVDGPGRHASHGGQMRRR